MVYYCATTKTVYIIGVIIVHKELLLIVLTTSKMADSEGNLFNVREFSEVILTLQNVLLPQEKLSPTPSMLDGLDSETEMDLRILGCELIQTSGILLKLPQVAMATGQVLFQRFYHAKSFIKHTMEVVAMACVNLASKIEEAPRRIRDVINVFHHIKLMRNGKTISPLILDQNYISLKNQVIKGERRILKELGFCVHVKHPHKIIVMFLQVLECERNQPLVQCSWNYMNDSFRTNVFVRYYPETIACACIYLAARRLSIPLPNNPPWYALFSVTEEEIQEICITILELYARPKPVPDALEKVVNEVKKLHVEAKQRAKGITSDGNTPNSTSRPSSPSKATLSPLSLPYVKKLRTNDDKSDHSFGSGHDRHTSRKKRNHSSHSRSRSHSQSSDDRGHRSYGSSSRSASRSPVLKRRYRSPISKKFKKESRRRRRHSRDKDVTIKSRDHDKYYQDRGHYRSPSYGRSVSLSPDHPHVSRKKHGKDRQHDYKVRAGSHDRHKKKHNGHRDSRTRNRYRR
ncbi:hypothetical protein NP493_312g02016 [Ridgeia piscesae]|uniref:Cyclin-L1 n=1 Tax=Ridgeia piscesae TaxID=27915 RepID=A0AAD9NW25_RIDPI|nr:hypothetical protein NP493_312g02016 [Ridgeia piscesae]